MRSLSGGQEFNGIGDGDFTDIFGFKVEEFYALADFLSQCCIMQFTGYQHAACHLAGWRNGEFQYDLALQGWVFPQGPIIDAENGTLVTPVNIPRTVPRCRLVQTICTVIP